MDRFSPFFPSFSISSLSLESCLSSLVISIKDCGFNIGSFMEAVFTNPVVSFETDLVRTVWLIDFSFRNWNLINFILINSIFKYRKLS